MTYTDLACELFDTRTSLLKMPKARRVFESEKGELFALHFIMLSGGETHPKQISDEMGVSTARITAILNRLEEKGFAERITDGSDSRQVIVRITGNGRTFICDRYNEIISRTADMLEALGESDANEYIRIQKRISEYFARDSKSEGDINAT